MRDVSGPCPRKGKRSVFQLHGVDFLTIELPLLPRATPFRRFPMLRKLLSFALFTGMASCATSTATDETHNRLNVATPTTMSEFGTTNQSCVAIFDIRDIIDAYGGHLDNVKSNQIGKELECVVQSEIPSDHMNVTYDDGQLIVKSNGAQLDAIESMLTAMRQELSKN